jgi:hypothetical protein
MLTVIIIIIIIPQGVKKFNTANMKILPAPDIFGLVHLPKIYHNVILPSLAGLPKKGFPTDFLTEILYTLPKPLH